MFQLQSESINEVATALAKAQGKFPPIPKSKTATVNSAKGSYSYNYADIADVLAAVRPVLAAEGLALIQAVETTEQGRPLLKTLLVHGGGQYIGSQILLNPSGGPQDLGSQLTYYRRFGATALLGVAAEEDDDGGRAQEAAVASRQGQQRHPQAPSANRKPDPRPAQMQGPAKPADPKPETPWTFPQGTALQGKRPDEVPTDVLQDYLGTIQAQLKEAGISAAQLTGDRAAVFNAVGAELLKRRKAEAQAMAAQPEPLVRTDSLVDDFASFDGRR